MLANVINKLAENKTNYIPYRDSKLTRLLSQALGGNSLTAMICTVSPAAQNYYQTLSTLRFASRAKIIKNKAALNEIIDEKSVLEFYKSEVKRLQKELQNLKLNTSQNSIQDKELTNHELQQLMKTNETLTSELEALKQKYTSEKDKNELMQKNLNSTLSNLANSRNPAGDNENSSNINESGNIYNRPGFNSSNINSSQYDNADKYGNPYNQYNQIINNNTNSNIGSNFSSYKQSEREQNKDTRDYREPNIRDIRDTRDPRDPRDLRDQREPQRERKPNPDDFFNNKYVSKDYTKDLNFNYGNFSNFGQQNPTLNTISVNNTSQNNSNIYNTQGDDKFLKDFKPNPSQSKLQYDYQKESFYIDSMLTKLSQNNYNYEMNKDKNWRNESERIASSYK